MSVTFTFQAPNTQTGGTNVDAIKIYASADALAFTLEATDTIAASDTSYVYAAGDASTYYRISFEDSDDYESPQSDTMYGDDAYMSATVATIVNYIRIDLGDFDSTDYTYSDTQMKSFLDKAINIILKGALTLAEFNYTYAAGAITPDPSANTDNDVAVRRLMVLAAEMIIERNEYRDALGRTIKIRDGDTELDTGGSLGTYGKLVAGPGGAASEFKAALREFAMVGGDGSSGGVVGYY